MSDNIMSGWIRYGGTFNAPTVRVVATATVESGTIVSSTGSFTKDEGRRAWVEMCRAMGQDPDGVPLPLPQKPAQFREFEAQKHDFIGALYRPYQAPI